jgi:hypothetical protein
LPDECLQLRKKSVSSITGICTAMSRFNLNKED